MSSSAWLGSLLLLSVWVVWAVLVAKYYDSAQLSLKAAGLCVARPSLPLLPIATSNAMHRGGAGHEICRIRSRFSAMYWLGPNTRAVYNIPWFHGQ